MTIDNPASKNFWSQYGRRLDMPQTPCLTLESEKVGFYVCPHNKASTWRVRNRHGIIHPDSFDVIDCVGALTKYYLNYRRDERPAVFWNSSRNFSYKNTEKPWWDNV